jgi:pimeloyl-ACP methyl ester carboxylesterase
MKTPIPLFIGVLLIGCGAPNSTEQQVPMPKNTFVLVSGSWHGAWCWEKLTKELEAQGQDVIAVELPGHGTDTTPVKDITLDSYVKAVCDSIAHAGRKVILVGHSRGGIAISQGAETCPENIARLVYLAAFLIPDGQPMVATAMSDTGSLLVRNLELDTVQGWHMPKAEAVAAAFYHDCPADDAAAAAAQLTREPNAPVATPLHLTKERFGSIPRTYIKTLDDRAPTPAVQDRMLAALPCDTVYTMNTSHSPFLSKPRELAEILVRIAAR